jgi:hypothetical protein
MIALLIALQWATAPTQAFAGQYITGSLVNCVLAVATMLGGMYCGIVVALLSPFCAFLLGIGPQLIQVVPVIALGNIAFVVTLHLLLRPNKPFWYQEMSVIPAALVKFGVLYLGVKMLLPAMGFPLPPKLILMLSSYPQLVTAFVGGTLAMLLFPLLRKTIK